MSKPGPARVAMDSVLTDGCWHQVSELMAAGARAIPFPVAVRRWETDKAVERVRKSVGEAREMSVDDRVASGARRFAADALKGGLRSGVWERVDDRVRLRPQTKEQA